MCICAENPLNKCSVASSQSFLPPVWAQRSCEVQSARPLSSWTVVWTALCLWDCRIKCSIEFIGKICKIKPIKTWTTEMADESSMAHILLVSVAVGRVPGVVFMAQKLTRGLVFLRKRVSFKCGDFSILQFLTCTQGYSLNTLPEFGWTSQKILHCGSPSHIIWVPPLQACYLHLSKDNSLWLVPAGLPSTACRALISARLSDGNGACRRNNGFCRHPLMR